MTNSSFNSNKGIALLALPFLLFALTNTVDVSAKAQGLKPKQVTSFKHLKKLLNKKSIRNNHYLMLKSLATVDGAAVFSASDTSAASPEHSDTNVQVAGVDEGDNVKTDGNYIYRIQDNQVRIISAYPASSMALTSSIKFDDGFYPIELYVKDNLLVVIGTAWHADSDTGEVPVLPNEGHAKIAIWAPSGESRTTARVYDISNRATPVMQRQVAVSGDYLSSRRIDNQVYLLARKYPYYFMYTMIEPMLDGNSTTKNSAMTRDTVLPHIVDSAVNQGAEHTLALNDLYYFPNFVEPDYVVVGSFRLDAPNDAATIKAYLGSGDIAYSSKDNLYLSAADYNYNTTEQQTVSAPSTHIYKFSLNNGAINFNNTGEVPGTVLNSYSMDEHNGYFRIATTTDQWTQTGDTGTLQTWNNLYTLDGNMAIAGRLEHLAEGERIFSARFMGDRGYLVTFEQTDPLFVIDLATPTAPSVLGELKIPGFSNYLHPYDDTHLLGFGQDTKETENGFVTGGMKVALFDVSDVAHPTETASVIIGAQWSYSPVQWDPKALWFDKKRSLIGFPISITEQKAGQEWPTEVFQGAHVYKVDLANGFKKQAEITHRDQGVEYDWYHYIDRLLSIDTGLYSLSPTRIQAHDLTTFTQLGSLDIPVEPVPVDCVLPAAEVDPNAAAAIAYDCPILVEPVVSTPVP
ncbi:beta-propeller domain-containing protein [Methylocucumis oryzae]|uniref:beta-propeller domain-containing protein n=1 Tax=Methylocucumis oryzae TaxID=1632867 RepID=UPI00069818BB|nr:beta-propeller domain-containing protein [Methylocucumis oryzae]